MPNDLLLMYCRQICGLLRNRIKGEVYVNGINDKIVVEISWYDFQYSCTINKVADMVHKGISSECIGEWICRNFKNVMLTEVFV